MVQSSNQNQTDESGLRKRSTLLKTHSQFQGPKRNALSAKESMESRDVKPGRRKP